MRVAGSHSGPIAVETGIPVEILAASARNAGIPARRPDGGAAGPLESALDEATPLLRTFLDGVK
jgi:hypothetical protein